LFFLIWHRKHQVPLSSCHLHRTVVAYFPTARQKNKSLWLDCCVRHDFAYWKGGTYQERLDADLALEKCVDRLGEPKIAKLMLKGVRAGGSPQFPSPYRWGYGWPFPRNYQALNDEERMQVKAQLDTLQHMIDEVRIELSISAQ
jgi:hypothetical protein